MCRWIEHPSLAPGWGCCSCRVYNSPLRQECKQCGKIVCAGTLPSVVKVVVPDGTDISAFAPPDFVRDGFAPDEEPS